MTRTKRMRTVRAWAAVRISDGMMMDEPDRDQGFAMAGWNEPGLYRCAEVEIREIPRRRK